MKIEHNSRVELYRMPFGAVTKNTEVTLRLSLVNFGIPTHIRVCSAFKDTKKSVNMSYVYSLFGACVYEARIKMPDDVGNLCYYFDIASHENRIFYGNNEENLGGLGKIYTEPPSNKFQITVYDESFQTPDWWKNSVCYQIFPDRFFNGNPGGEFLGEREDIIRRNWGETPYYKSEQFGGKYLANDFFGGNLKGIEKKLPYLKELGISCLYLNPIFEAYSNHKYDTGNYKKIDPMFGTQADFEHLCAEAKKHGISIILDGVLNHTGSDSLYFNKYGKYDSLGAFQSKDSPYYDWYRFTKFPDEYESWWGIDTLPQVEENSESYRDYILRDDDAVVKKWLKCGARGWRLDVVDELPDSFVKILRSEVKKQDSDAVILGEVWEDASNKESYGEKREYFLGSELDSVMNYPLRSALIEYINEYIDAEEFDARIMSLKENYPKPAYYSTMNFLSSHDVERIMTVMGVREIDNDKDRQARAKLDDYSRGLAVSKCRCLVTMQMLMPGVPCVFYGDEAGVEGYRDPFCRSCYPWGDEDDVLIEFYRKNIALRNENEVFRSGEFETVYKINNGYGFIRYDEIESYIVLINSGDAECFRLDVARYGICELYGVFHNENYSSEDGIYYIDMPRYAVKIFKKVK